MEHEAVFLGMRAAEVWGVSAALITTVIFYIIARISGDPKDRK